MPSDQNKARVLTPSSSLSDSMRNISRLTFLDFPYSFREAVYLQCNIVSCCAVLLNGAVPKSIAESAGVSRDRDHLRFSGLLIGPCFRRGIDDFSACAMHQWLFTARNLFLVCRKVSKETKRLVYSRNKFVIHRCAPNGLGLLSQLSPTDLSWITCLRIEVNTRIETHAWETLHFDKERRGICNCWTNGFQCCICNRSDGPMDISTDQGIQALKDFQETIRLLNKVIQPGQLDLGIICDSQNVETAEAFANAMSILPQLKRCSIRFSITSNESLRSIANKTVQMLTTTNKTPLDLSKLPTELKWEVFKHMGLIAPYDLEWKGSGPRPGYNLHLNYFRSQHQCLAIKGWSHSRSSFATSCQSCWIFPVELFLLNKECNSRATEIFFERNHFILLPNRGYTLPGRIFLDFLHHQRPPSYSFFFNNIPAIEHMRSIQFVIPMKGEMLSEDDSHLPGLTPEQSNYWINSITMLLQHAQLKKLRLTLDFATLDHIPREEKSISDSRLSWEKRLSQFTNTVLQGIPMNEGLKAFQIYLPENSTIQGLNGKYEKLIMGEHFYDIQNVTEQHQNRSKYWYTFVTGWTIVDSPYMDSVYMYWPLPTK